MTEKYRRLKWLFFGLSSACTLIPVIVFFIIGLASGDITVMRKFALSASFAFVIVVAVIGFIRKYHYRCSTWVFILGCYLAMNYFAPILVTFGCCCVLDELVFTPLYKKYKELTTINKQIDKRMIKEGE